MRALGKNIKALRKIKGLTLKDLDGLTNISTVTLSKIERGGNPRAGTVETIADALGVTVSDLYDEDIEFEQELVVRSSRD